MKRILLLLFVVCNFNLISFSQSTSVSYPQQTGNYNTTFSSGGGAYSPNGNQIGTYANGSGSKQFVAWRPFTTDGSATLSKRRALQVGDQFSIVGTFAQAYGEIGISLLASPGSELTWADRTNNYAVQVNLDGPGILGGSAFGNWYIKGAATNTASFGGVQGTGHNAGLHNFTFTFTLTAPDRMNISVTDNTSSAVFNAYDVQLNNTQITDFAIYQNDDWDGGNNQDAFWGWASGPNTSVQSTGAISIGAGNTSFSESNRISDGIYADQTSTAYTNTFTKNGNGTLTLTAANTFTGNISVSSGNLQLNHSGGGTIPATSNINIAHGATLQVSSNQTVNNLTLASVGTLIVDNGVTLTTNGRFNQNGGTVTLNGTGTIIYGSSGTLSYSGSTAQLSGGELAAIVPNLIVSDFAGVTLNSPVGVTGLITLINGTLTTGNNLTLISSAGSSGSIGLVDGFLNTGSIIGNVNVQRYIGSSQQWRMVGFPFTTATTISESALAGFFSSGYKAYTYNEAADDETHYGSSGAANAGWTGFTSGTISSSQGILINGGTPSSVINFSGPVNAGTTLTALTVSKKGWNFISNPFASNINWITIALNNSSLVNNAIYRYDPNTTAYATYVGGISAGNQSNVIENGAGFFVQATSAGNLSISENDKTTSAPAASLMGIGSQRGTILPDGSDNTVSNTTTNSIIKLSLSKEGDAYADEAVVRWGVEPATDYFDGKYDAYDMGRVVGPDLSVVGNDGTVYSIFHGSALQTKDKEQRVISLGIKNMEAGTYILNSALIAAMFDGNEVYLLDHYTNQSALISTDNASYSFNVTADPNSASVSRFSIAFNYKVKLDITPDNIKLLNNPSNLNQFKIVSGSDYQKLNWELLDNSGRLLESGVFSNVTNGTVNIAQTHNLVSGTYFIRLTGDAKELATQKWIKQ